MVLKIDNNCFHEAQKILLIYRDGFCSLRFYRAWLTYMVSDELYQLIHFSE